MNRIAAIAPPSRRFAKLLLILPITLAIFFALPARADDPQPVLQLDDSLTAAIARADKPAVAALLADNFEFTDIHGVTRTKAQSLDALSQFLTAAFGSTAVHSYNYGDVAFIIGINADTRFLRIWTKQSPGWRLFIFLETPMTTRAPVAPGGGDCLNPCKTIPYAPTSDIDRAIVNAWQILKNDEWHPNATDWASHIADEFLIINSRTERPKAERQVLIAKQQENHEPGPPGDPVRSVRMIDFPPNAAVMLSIHTPYHGGKPYYNVRVWILRDSRWQLAVSQQTTIDSAAPAPAVTSTP